MKTLNQLLNEARALKNEITDKNFLNYYKDAVKLQFEDMREALDYYLKKCNKSSFESPLFVLASYELLHNIND